ncbi:putative quinol monooxygenase [Hylemonella gracilis]|nr:antibiotic biosynthesis monooxygenase [Hylemonella gracilis]
MSLKQMILAATLSAGSLLGAGQAFAADAPPDIKESPNGEIAVVATLEVKSGSEADFEKISRMSIMCSRLEPGNVSFTIHKALDTSKPTYVMYEVWRTKAALQSHFFQPYTQALFGAFKQHLSAPPAMSFIAELTPAPRSKPAQTDPKVLAECR